MKKSRSPTRTLETAIKPSAGPSCVSVFMRSAPSDAQSSGWVTQSILYPNRAGHSAEEMIAPSLPTKSRKSSW
jgi:hypothetical protein